MCISIFCRKILLCVCFLIGFFCTVRSIEYEPVTHVLFDLDGLLVDTETVAYEVGCQLCAKYGKEFNTSIKRKIMGGTQLGSAEIIIKELNLPLTPQTYVDQYHELLEARLNDVGILPGVEKLLLHLHKNNIPFAIATGSSNEMFFKKTRRFEKLFSFTDHVTAASSDPDVKQGKPAPDVFLVCAKRFKDQPHPSKCLVFEDAPGGVTAAVRAGMQVVMVPNDTFVVKDDPTKRKATLVLKSLEDFRPELFGLPSYDDENKAGLKMKIMQLYSKKIRPLLTSILSFFNFN